MGILSVDHVVGDKIGLLRTDDRHFNLKSVMAENEPKTDASFNGMLLEALNGVNDLQKAGNDLTQKMIVDPDSVDVHELTVAMAKANMALSTAKSVIDRALRAYREITTLQ